MKLKTNKLIKEARGTLPKEILKKCPTEAQECKALKTWADYHPIAKHMFHIPNGGSRHMLEAKNLKAQGAKAGVSDYFLPYQYKGKGGMFIELKRRAKSLSRLSQEQAEFLACMERMGYHTVIAYGAEDAIQKIEEYLK